MRRITVIILSFGFLIFGFGQRSHAYGELPRVTHEIMEKVAFDQIQNPEFGMYWSIWFTVNDRSLPAQSVSFTIEYDVINGEIHDWHRFTGQGFESSFATTQPFFDFVDYI